MTHPTHPSSVPPATATVEADSSPGSRAGWLRLGPTIDENADFKGLCDALAALPGPIESVRVDSRRTRRINSQGVRAWLQLVEDIQGRYRLEFAYVSEPFMELASMLPGVLGTPQAHVELVEVPFHCPKCEKASSPGLRLTDIKRSDGQIKLPSLSCEKCGKPLEVDIVEKEYFIAITRRPSPK